VDIRSIPARRDRHLDYLDASIEELERTVQAIPGDGRVSWDVLDRLFLKSVRPDT